MNEPWRCYAESKKPDTKGHTLYDPFICNIQNKNIYGDRRLGIP